MFAMAMNMSAQVNQMTSDDVKEDFSDSDRKSLTELIKDNDNATVIGKITDHFADVWSRKSYVNLTYTNADFKINTLPEGDQSVKPGKVYKSDWGIAFNLGTQYNLHKPIANMATINLDYSYLNIGVNHYAKEDNYEYKSTEHKINDNNKELYSRPWGGDKFEGSFGMSLGPSVTIAPFTHIDAQAVNALHYLKFNVYYHFGYNASVAYAKVEDKVEGGNSTKIDPASFDWGHGTYSEFGLCVSWKSIGFGFETRSGKIEYQPFDAAGSFGKAKYKIDNSMSRIYLQIRSGSKMNKKKK